MAPLMNTANRSLPTGVRVRRRWWQYSLAISLAALLVWTSSSVVFLQLRHLRYQGEGQTRRKREVYAVEDLGCDDCLPWTPAASSRMSQPAEAHESTPASGPASSAEDKQIHSLPGPEHPSGDRGRKGMAKQMPTSRLQTLADGAAAMAQRKASAAHDHEIRGAASWGVHGRQKAKRPAHSVPGSGKHLQRPALLLLAYRRPKLLAQTLASLSRLEGLEDFSVYLSQDGTDNEVLTALRGAVAAGSGPLAPPHSAAGEVWQHGRVSRKEAPHDHTYLTMHYGWALRRVFETRRMHDVVVVVEDDMSFSPDFLLYFQAVAGVLRHDSTLWCISSWNDNGHKELASNPRRLFRTSLFPGLGWLMTRSMWEEIGQDWPEDNWDWWLRQEDVAKGRDCVVPEISRNYNTGDKGANMDTGLYGRTLANWASHSGQPVRDFGDLGYLLKANYEDHLSAQLAKAAVWDWRAHGIASAPAGGTYIALYHDSEYQALGRQLPVWPLEPRAHHALLAEVHYRHSTFLLADSRRCPLLPPALVENPPAGLVAVLGRSGETSCDEGSAGCPHGCKYLQRLDTVIAPGLESGSCVVLTGTEPPPCGSSVAITGPQTLAGARRLCPCLP